MFAGVGGQGLILMTRIVSQAAMLDGFDIKIVFLKSAQNADMGNTPDATPA